MNNLNPPLIFYTEMEQTEYLEKYIFTDFKNINEGTDADDVQQFSEADFESLLELVEHNGIGVYNISTWLNGEAFEVAEHDDFKKKATDPKWYKKAFLTLKSRQAGLTYAATYKVSSKLLAKYTEADSED
ncbi:hypothetical protein [Aequorivita capsosiphonis]|uniref:hypothetical protein n=1 Tax=Aequorivita capsosiphonis TaxID=487317 RepID=UPI00040DD9F3|nr:hypothetical protein [Aequorivita capsosiphonis]